MIDPYIHHTLDDRLPFLLEQQAHCDEYLARIADPAGKSVLVAGAGAGTEMLWCLRRGAREVVGIDLLPQEPESLRRAAEALGIPADRPWQLLEMAIEDAPSLARRFDLVLSNNVFEHVGDLPAAFAACAAMIEPGRGRIAIFSNPLFRASTGSHRQHEPWEHLHRPELLAPDADVPLNRARLEDVLDGARRANLALVHLEVLPDRHLGDLPTHLTNLPHETPLDLGLEGYAMELVRIEAGPALARHELSSVSAARTYAERLASGRISRLFADRGEGLEPTPIAEILVDPLNESFDLTFPLPKKKAFYSFCWRPPLRSGLEVRLASVFWVGESGVSTPIDRSLVRSNGAPRAEGAWSFEGDEAWLHIPLPSKQRCAGLRLIGTWASAARGNEPEGREERERAASALGQRSFLFLDQGAGFTEMLAARVDPLSPRFSVRFERLSASHVTRVRWDPTEGKFATVAIEEVAAWTSRGERIDLGALQANGHEVPGSAIAFATLDPSFVWNVDSELAAFEVKGRWQVEEPASRVDALVADMAALRASRSYRLGRALTAPLRWLRSR